MVEILEHDPAKIGGSFPKVELDSEIVVKAGGY